VNLPRARLQERLAHVEQDLVDVDRQRLAGELDDVWAERLRAAYADERTDLQERLAAVEDGAEETPGWSRRRVAIAAVILTVAAVGITVGAVAAIEARNSGSEDAEPGVIGGQGFDLAEVTNEELEEVVAQFPNGVPMRLVLAHRYFYDGDFDKAFEHYMIILEEEQHPEALANVGWMTFLSGRADVAADLVERSLEIDPEAEISHWYLAKIRYEGLDDPAGAIEPLETLLSSDDLPDEVRTEAERMLASAREEAE